MATTNMDGIATRYEVVGSGPPLLMLAPGGFDATIEKWSTLNVYARVRPIDFLSKRYTCIAFDRRECGQSGGRVEAVTWKTYAAHAKALLDHLGFERAHLMGGCMGCSVALAFAVAYPQAMSGMILWWPVGGAKYRIRAQQRFAEHVAFVRERGLREVVSVATTSCKSFGAEPRGGPWASVIRINAAFAESFESQDVERYIAIVDEMARRLFDRDTSPGAEPEELLQLNVPALIVPGHDESHATSAARYLEECLPHAQYWDIPVEEQTAEIAAPRLLDFLAAPT